MDPEQNSSESYAILKRSQHLRGAIGMIEQADIQQVCDQIVEKFQPDKIILFGSYAYGTPTDDSDVDLLILMPFEGKAWKQASKIRCAIDYSFPSLDLVVRTPEEAISRYNGYDPIFRWAFNKGKILYERNTEDRSRVAS